MISKNDTWELSDLPEGRKPVGVKWVFKIKTDEKWDPVRYKARLVAQGFSQKFGVDYDEVFVPVARSTTFRMLLSLAGAKGYEVRHYDVTSAFLNGHLKEEIYLRQPPGFEKGNQVCKLKKSLYGLKQAAKVWNEALHEVLMECGCSQSSDDPCLYSLTDVCHILIHVDDLLVVGYTGFP